MNARTAPAWSRLCLPTWDDRKRCVVLCVRRRDAGRNQCEACKRPVISSEYIAAVDRQLAPVMNPDSGPQRKDTSATTWAGSPIRRRGTYSLSRSVIDEVMSVPVEPG